MTPIYKTTFNRARNYTKIVSYLFLSRFVLLGVFCLLGLFSIRGEVAAANLTFVSDTISTSRPGVGADHKIRFTTTNLIPVSGAIIVTLEAGFFGMPVGLDYTDIDFSINGAEKNLGLFPGITKSGIVVVGGSVPQITITLSETTFISPQSVIVIKIGKNAA